jgi:dolichyl-diphosphooligosaccharide--protein glycosyltransferase
MKKKILFSVVGAILAGLLMLPLDKGLAAGLGFGVLAIGLIVLYALKKILKVHAFTAVLSYITVFVVIIFYLMPAAAISQSQGTVLSDNWWQALNWIKNNTDECATIATYWDPGHFITGIANRAVVFDGASQNALFVKPYNGTENGLKIIPYDNGIKELKLYENGNETRARIKDITAVMLTANESLAVDILRDYAKPNCSEIYFIASSDLIFKSQWWSYFATWDPTREGDQPLSKGDIYTYAVTQLARRKPLAQFGVVGYEYPLSQSQSLVLCQQNNTIAPCSNTTIGLFQSGEQFARLRKIVWPTDKGLYTMEDKNAEVPGTVLVLDTTAQTVAYLRPELENALFTRMFFYNGAGLEKFELVNSWGGEVKLFKVKFNETG